jgi:O-antigen/teichoic acid export membrane protein
MNYQGRLLGQYFSILFFSIFAFILLKKRRVLTYKISKEFIKDALLFGLPIVPHVIGGMVINMSDKIFISHILGNSELGIYNMGYTIGATISMLSTSFANSIVPVSYSLFNKGDCFSKEKVVKIYWVFIISLAFIVFLISLLAPFIFDYFINQQFIKGVSYVKWISLGYFFHGCYLLFVNVIFYVKKTNILFYLSIMNIVVNLISNYLLINKYGAVGATFALCISYFVLFISTAIISNKLYSLPWFFFLKKIHN